MKRKYIILIIIAVVLVVLGIIISYLRGIEGVVVDSETGKPIEGAVVLVEWTQKVGIGDYNTESAKVVEMFTDKEGRFRADGLLNPFVDLPNVTVYKKGYVAWNNKRIFPDYKHRQFSKEMYQEIKLDLFKKSYSHNQHVGFIRTCIHDALESYKKRTFAAAYEWEIDLARGEVLREK